MRLSGLCEPQLHCWSECGAATCAPSGRVCTLELESRCPAPASRCPACTQRVGWECEECQDCGPPHCTTADCQPLPGSAVGPNEVCTTTNTTQCKQGEGPSCPPACSQIGLPVPACDASPTSRCSLSGRPASPQFRPSQVVCLTQNQACRHC